MTRVGPFVGPKTLVPGSVFGLRKWNIDSLGRLKPLHMGRVPFRPDGNVAHCEFHSERDHKVPQDNCSCGYYAFWSHREREDSYVGDIQGIIEGFGSTIIGDHGFRCEKARLVAVVDPRKLKHTVKRTRLHRITGCLLPRNGSLLSYSYLDAIFVVLMCVALTICIVSFSGGLSSLLVTAAVVLMGYLSIAYAVQMSQTASNKWTRPPRDKHLPSYEREEQRSIALKFESFKRVYPNVPVYLTLKDMLKAHPVSSVEDFAHIQPEILTPDTVPDFWERP